MSLEEVAECMEYADWCFPCNIANCPFQIALYELCAIAECGTPPPQPIKNDFWVWFSLGLTIGGVLVVSTFCFARYARKIHRRTEERAIPMVIINQNYEPYQRLCQDQDDSENHPSIVRFSCLQRAEEEEESLL